MTRGQLGPFLAKLARVEPDKAMSLIESVRQPATRLLAYAEAANALAIEHPGQAERYYDRLENANRPNFHARKSFVAMQLCRAMARSDAPRARRIAAALETREERACAWACLAAGLAGRDQAGAREALERAIHEIDDLLKPPTTPGQVDPNNSVHGGLVFNLAPAGAILPMVEKVDPDRVPEVFWRGGAGAGIRPRRRRFPREQRDRRPGLSLLTLRPPGGFDSVRAGATRHERPNSRQFCSSWVSGRPGLAVLGSRSHRQAGRSDPDCE